MTHGCSLSAGAASLKALWEMGFDEFVLVGPYVLSFFKLGVD